MEFEVVVHETRESLGFFETRDEAQAWICTTLSDRRGIDIVPVGEIRRYNERAAMIAAALREILAERGL